MPLVALNCELQFVLYHFSRVISIITNAFYLFSFDITQKQIRTHPRKEVRSDLLGMVHHRGLEPRTH